MSSDNEMIDEISGNQKLFGILFFISIEERAYARKETYRKFC
jgi:hypothetical protein